MLKRLLHRYTRGFEQRYKYDASYMHEMIETSLSAFVRFAIMQSAAGSRHDGAPLKALCAAGIAGALVEDCGPCVQIASDMALEAGIPGEIITALLSGKPTDPDAQLGFDYGRALLNAAPDLDNLRDQIEKTWGKRALLAISLRVITARNFPVLKRAMGHSRLCQYVRIGDSDVAVSSALKAA